MSQSFSMQLAICGDYQRLWKLPLLRVYRDCTEHFWYRRIFVLLYKTRQTRKHCRMENTIQLKIHILQLDETLDRFQHQGFLIWLVDSYVPLSRRVCTLHHRSALHSWPVLQETIVVTSTYTQKHVVAKNSSQNKYTMTTSSKRVVELQTNMYHSNRCQNQQWLSWEPSKSLLPREHDASTLLKEVAHCMRFC